MQAGSSDENVVTVSEPQRRDGSVSWRGWMDGDQRHGVFAEFTWLGGRLRPTARPWLLAFLPIAMRSGRRRLVIDGAVDQGTLHNAWEWQEMHHRLWPKSTRVVDLRVQVAPETKIPKGAGSVTCFSGGVDSAFTLLRHRPSAPPGPYRQTMLSAGLMVHGFDVPLREIDQFDKAFARSARMLEASGVTPLRLRTNLRQVGRRAGLGWGKVAHGPALAASLAFVEQAHDRVLIPSSYSYEYMAKWGSTTVGDPLLGSGARPIWHDGAGVDKIDKILALAQDPALCADLRVCFENAERDANCGRCYKCLHTQTCLWLAGIDDPVAFPRRATIEEISGITFKSHYRYLQAKRVLRLAEKQGRTDLAAAYATAIARADQRASIPGRAV